MTAQSLNFEIDPYSDTNFELDWTDPSTNLPIDLTGYTAGLQVRDMPYSTTVLLELTSTNGDIVLGGSDGTILVKFSRDLTNLLEWSRGHFDLYITNTLDSNRTTVCRGFVTRVSQISQ